MPVRTRTSARRGFAGDFSYLHVTALGSQTGGGGRVQEGVDYIADGSLTGGNRVVDLNAGSYFDNVTVDRPLKLLGPNAALAGDDLGRGAEAILYTAINDSDDAAIVNVQSSNVTIGGLTIDGDNPNMSGGAAVGAADANAAEGIQNSASYLGPFAQINHVTITNNVIKNLPWQGVYLEVDFNTNQSWNYIQDNLFENLKEGIQTYAIHTDISNNTMIDVNRGVSIHGTNVAADVGFTPKISNNDISLAWNVSTGTSRCWHLGQLPPWYGARPGSRRQHNYR